MPSGLSLTRVVNVTMTLSPQAAPTRNFGALLILGASDRIDVGQRLRAYAALDDLAQDFATTDPEYLAAQLFFSQNPRPAIAYVGRWARTAAAAQLNGGVLNAAEQALGNFTAATNGGLTITVNGTVRNVTGLNLSGAANLNAVAALLTTALSTATCTWDAVRRRFIVRSSTTGPASTLTFATPPGSGTDLTPLLKLGAAQASPLVPGIAAEGLLAAAQAMVNAESDWYGLMVADTTPSNADHLQVAAYIEGLSRKRIYGATITASTVLDGTVNTDLASQLQAAGYTRSFTQYSANPYAVASIFGRAFTVDFTANRTTITLKFKQQPGVVPETLTEDQANVLRAKNCNVLVRYNNGTAIIQEGVMASGLFFDERHGTDWQENDIQTTVWNLLYTSPTKVPQTDSGAQRVVAAIAESCQRGINNGLVAPGRWNGPDVGALRGGGMLNEGFYIFCPPMEAQAQADREARRLPAIQVALKLAGAVHSADVLVNVNR